MNIELTFTHSNDALIARAENGMICFLVHGHKPVKAGETWDCEVTEEKPTLMIVKPLKRLLTAEQNIELFRQKAEELKKHFS